MAVSYGIRGGALRQEGLPSHHLTLGGGPGAQLMTKGLGLEAVIKHFVTFPLDERGKHSISLFLSLSCDSKPMQPM